MDDDAIHTDGNGVAGMLQEIFLAEITTATRLCDGCGEEHPIGAHRAYTGAGTVLRCPSCGAMAATVTARPDDYVVGFTGAWRFERRA
jgi:hypothetical protein